MTGPTTPSAHPTDDIARLRMEYRDRAQRLKDSDTYSLFNPAHLFMIQQRQRASLKMLREHGLYPLAGKQILEIGCGNGYVLQEYLSGGAAPASLHGIDLLKDRITDAHTRLPQLPLVCANGQHLPYPSGKFDLVLQYTAFS